MKTRDHLLATDYQFVRHSAAFMANSTIVAKVKVWWPLLPLLLIGFLFRAGDMPLAKGTYDNTILGNWARAAVQFGLFRSYLHGEGYPPFYTTVLYFIGLVQVGRGLPIDPYEPGMFLMLKIVPVFFDLLLIAGVFAWLRHRPILRWLIPLWLALYPGMMIISAWRSQVDIIVVAFEAFGLIALNRDRPQLAWAFWALSVLMKLQGIFLGPLLLVLTYRRYGWRKAAICIGVFCLVYGGEVLPFAIGSGLPVMIRHLTFADNSTALTAHALNFWYLANPTTPAIPSMNIPIWGPLTARSAGLTIFGAFYLFIMVHAWRNAEKQYEFVWAASLNFVFFVFLTQMLERYLFYGAVLLPIAVAQEPQLWVVALGVTYTFTLNNVTVWTGNGFTELGEWLGEFLWLQKYYILAALLNIAFVFEIIRILGPGRGLYKWFFQLTRLATIALAVVLIFYITHDTLSYYPTANWLTNNVARETPIAIDTVGVTQYVDNVHPGAGWVWNLVPEVESKSVSEWREAGVQYIVADDSANDNEDFTARVSNLEDQGATLLYETNGLLWINSREAVLWSSRPQKQTNLVFDKSLRLIGYDVVADGDKKSLVFYWYVDRKTAVDFNLFIHLIDANGGQLVGQADTIAGQWNNPTSAWQLHQIVSERYELPEPPSQGHYLLQIGLYELSSGRRAPITDMAGIDQGDLVNIALE